MTTAAKVLYALRLDGRSPEWWLRYRGDSGTFQETQHHERASHFFTTAAAEAIRALAPEPCSVVKCECPTSLLLSRKVEVIGRAPRSRCPCR